MDVVIEVIKQDISAALKALDKNDFRFINIMGNRIASNLLIGERSELMVISYLLREVGHEFEGIKRTDEKRLSGCRKYGEKFLTGVRSAIGKEKISSKEIWDLYYEYENNIRKYIPTDIEISSLLRFLYFSPALGQPSYEHRLCGLVHGHKIQAKTS